MLNLNLIGNNHIRLDSVDSTNSKIKLLFSEGKINFGTIVSTSYQSVGRGQRENIWESKKGQNILMSFIFSPQLLADNQFLISKAVSLAIFDLLSEYTDNVKIKWPNDIYINDKKVAGILIENSLRGIKIINSIVGIGLNVNQLIFNATIPNPTSLFIEMNMEFNIDEVFNKLIVALNVRVNSLLSNDFDKINSDYLLNLYRINKFYFFEANEKKFKAKIKAIDKIGRLVLELENSDLQQFGFKEVKFL